MSDLVYLYGFVPLDAPSPAPDLPGIDDAAVELLDIGAARAVISQLPAAAYNAETLEARLEDMAWVGQQGLAHERVVLWYVDHAEIIPARLFSLYAGIASLRGALAARGAEIAATLRSLAGRREWNLKVAYDAAVLAHHAGEVSDEVRLIEHEIAAATPGRRYLLERKRADILKREVAHAARRLAQQLLAALARHAERHRVLPLAAADEAGTVVLYAALLVPRAAEAGLQAEAASGAQELGRLGLSVNFSGPWAAYRFLESDVDA